jgi:hypothetical protein
MRAGFVTLRCLGDGRKQLLLEIPDRPKPAEQDQ